MAPWLASRAETLVVNYHNITPPELMAPWDNHLALGQLRAQGDLRLLAPRAALAIADSAYNEAHLAEAGFRATAVVPPSADLATTARTPATAATHGAGGGARWLAVGRVSPNKALESTVAALAVARVHHDPGATLRLVGKPATGSYVTALRRYVADLGLADAVTFAGHASDDTVAAAYAEADVLVVTSEHEGFCVPVVEAMSAGLPVVAFDRGAVPEVVGDAGRPRLGQGPLRPGRLDRRGAGRRRTAPRAGRGRRPPARCARPRHRGRPLRRPGGHAGGARRSDVSPAVHQFVPMLHRADAVGRHTLRLREVMAARGIASEIYVELVDPDTSADTRPVAGVRRRGPARGRARVPIRHRVLHGAVVGRAHGDAGGQPPQRHPAAVLRTVGQRHGAAPAAGRAAAARPGAARRARSGGVRLQRGGAARGRLRPHRGRPARRHAAGTGTGTGTGLTTRPAPPAPPAPPAHPAHPARAG